MDKWSPFNVAIWAGVVSGLITSLITVIIVVFWKKAIEPWIANLLYRGARIDGIWKGQVSVDGKTLVQHVSIKQNAYKIAGTITYPQDTEGHAHTYKFKGRFVDNVLTALAQEDGIARTDQGALALTLKSGVSEIVMEGQGTWLDDKSLITVKYKWILETSTTALPEHVAD